MVVSDAADNREVLLVIVGILTENTWYNFFFGLLYGINNFVVVVISKAGTNIYFVIFT